VGGPSNSEPQSDDRFIAAMQTIAEQSKKSGDATATMIRLAEERLSGSGSLQADAGAAVIARAESEALLQESVILRLRLREAEGERDGARAELALVKKLLHAGDRDVAAPYSSGASKRNVADTRQLHDADAPSADRLLRAITDRLDDTRREMRQEMSGMRMEQQMQAMRNFSGGASAAHAPLEHI